MSKKSATPVIVVAALALLIAIGPAAAADSKSCRPWCAAFEEVAGDAALRLERADYQIELFGAVAVGTLVQQFLNDSEREFSAIYRFSAPANLRPSELEFEVDGQIIEASTTRRSEKESKGAPGARGAKQSKAPRIDSMPIPAGAQVIVRSRFQTSLSIQDGRLRLRLPAINAADQADQAGPLPTSIQVVVHHDEPLAFSESKSHELLVSYEGDRTVIELADGVDLTATDFDLDVAIGPEDDPTLLGFVGREKEGTREVLAVLTPPSKPNREAIRPKQVVFVLDTSGSMAKGKLDQAKQALYASLVKLSDKDAFNIVEFDGAFTMMSPEPVSKADVKMEQANGWLQSQRPGGRTRLLPALTAAFELPVVSGHHSMIVILTDGNVQDPREVEGLLSQKLGDGRLFVLGVGEDVKQENILRFAEYGRGMAAFVEDPEGMDVALANMFDSVSEPLAWDLELDLEGAEIELVKPSRLPDLYAGRPVTIRAKVRGDLPTELKIHGETMSGPRTFTAILTESASTGR